MAQVYFSPIGLKTAKSWHVLKWWIAEKVVTWSSNLYIITHKLLTFQFENVTEENLVSCFI